MQPSEFKTDEANKILSSTKRIEGDENDYYKAYYKKINPDYCIEGYYNIIDANGKKKLQLRNIACKTNHKNEGDVIRKQQFEGTYEAVLTESDLYAGVKTGGNYYGEGRGNSIENARNKAMEAMLSNISSSLEAKFYGLKSSDDEDIKELSKAIISTYSNRALAVSEEKVISDEPGKYVIARFMTRNQMDKLFNDRAERIIEFCNKALTAEKELRLADALRYYYWAYAYLCTHPEYNSLKHTFQVGTSETLFNSLTDRLDRLVSGISMEVTGQDYNIREKKKTVQLEVRSNGKAVQNFDFTYYTGASYSEIIGTINGKTAIEFYGEEQTLPDNIKWIPELQYMKQADYELKKILENISVPRVKSNLKQTPLKSATPAPAAENKKAPVTMSELSLKTSTVSAPVVLSEAPALSVHQECAQIVSKITDAIKNKQYDIVKNFFTGEGYSVYEKIVKYGKATVLGIGLDLKVTEVNGEIMVRSVPMKFSFQGNNKQFSENINFVFTKDKKVDNMTFGLSENAVNDIFSKGQWPEEHKYTIINFMENYKTAFALKRLDYIESIFDNDALIIIGKKLQKAENIDIEYGKLKNTDFQYIKKSKKEYMDALRANFANNEFVNIQFDRNDVLKRDAKAPVYGIQIEQTYFSSNYSDFGYLFLLIDFKDSLKPKIMVRSWQPEKDPQGRIIGVDSFDKN